MDLVARSGIMALQHDMIKAVELGILPKQDCEVRHYFPPNQYCREMLIPENTVIVGKIHRHAHMNTISMGILLVHTEFDTYEVHAPYSFISEPGTKRVVVALTDVMWTTYHNNPTNTQDLVQLEREIIAPDYLALGNP